ncbi:hypothetical protein ASPFODRAFT_49953 [Aspergillus luchuensis CBS 106.47]|uniref:Uncharacterized protein n=1 Tax=Aspergillus luchuensis (strain CBS 106.47) TaxID=1137211 RepID=A0A1M3T9B8_ASPLC|nr:hypothetical protein ASPFODRAFT_49953 [Aspergillus luchuensis CBS 106.47]
MELDRAKRRSTKEGVLLTLVSPSHSLTYLLLFLSLSLSLPLSLPLVRPSEPTHPT